MDNNSPTLSDSVIPSFSQPATAKKRKYLPIIIAIAYVILFIVIDLSIFFIILGVYSFRLKQNNMKIDLFESIKQKEAILQAVTANLPTDAQNSDRGKCFIAQRADYEKSLPNLCLKNNQPANCNIQQLDINSLQKMNNSLETVITGIIQCPQEDYVAVAEPTITPFSLFEASPPAERSSE